MPNYQNQVNTEVELQIFAEFQGIHSTEWLISLVKRTIILAGVTDQTSLSLVIADDMTVKELNYMHRGLDESTDVLAFSFTHQGEYYGEDLPETLRSQDIEFALPPRKEVGLGEVIISYPVMERQAHDAGRSVKEELAHLIIHGVLHLLGYDHIQQEEAQVMKQKESEVLLQTRCI